MSSSSSQRRQRRSQRREQQQQQQERQQQPIQNMHESHSPKDPLSPPSNPHHHHHHSSPHHHHHHHHNSHPAIPPKHLLRDEQPLSSGQMSDMSFEDFSSGAQDSVLEYSDTDDDFREEASTYFMSGLSSRSSSFFRNLGGRNSNTTSINSNTTTSFRMEEASGESAFRRLREQNSKSSRVVRFASGGSHEQLGFSFQDEYQAVDEDGLIHPPSSYPSSPPPPPPPPNRLMLKISSSGGVPAPLDAGLFNRNWLNSLAYAFRSPSPQNSIRNNNSNGSLSRMDDKEATTTMKSNKNGRTHPSQKSSATMEYPYASILPSYKTSAAEQHEKLAGSPTRLSSSSVGSSSSPIGGREGNEVATSWEQSPLLPPSTTTITPKTVYGAGEEDPLRQNNNLYPPPMEHSLLLQEENPTTATTGSKNKSNSGKPPRSPPPSQSSSPPPPPLKQRQPHLPRLDSFQVHGPSGMSRTRATTIAAYFLMDYEAGRPPTLSSNFQSITPNQLRLYRFHFLSWPWRVFGIYGAILALFGAHAVNNFRGAILHTYSILVFLVEIHAREKMYEDKSVKTSHSDRPLVGPMILFLMILGTESWLWTFVGQPVDFGYQNLFSAWLKPLVFFYASARAREAVEALSRIARMVTRILLIEVFLILTFAAVACRLFHDYDSFNTLARSWLSLFELSTTVVNPSLWMPIYETSRWNATFFIFFIVTAVFYLHSLLLSVVFQTYVQAATEIHERSATDREDAVRLAFLALAKVDQTDVISTSNVRRTLQAVRPHYNAMKIKALMEIVDPASQHYIDYPTFRTKIRQALNASIRTSRNASNFAMGVELIAVLVAVVNFIYVLLLASEFQADWFDAIAAGAGSIITVLGLLELLIRFNPLRVPNFAPITRLNGTFDGLALIAALVSCIGIVQYTGGFGSGSGSAIDLILMGRAIDMIRIMRFFPIFRDVVRRSADVLPAMAGPVILVLTTLHVFVYIGMALWGSAVDPDVLAQNSNVTPLYYLNNFNSYSEGLVTMFNVLVVNDWHALAEVFLYADRCSSPFIVYPFFVTAILIAVFIMLNVITAFFVEAFVTKLSDGGNTDMTMGDGIDPPPKSDRDFVIQTGENSQPNVKHISSGPYLAQLDEEPADSSTEGDKKENNEKESSVAGTDNDDDEAASASSSSSTEIFTFDVYAREGFDQIMKTVAGSSDAQEEMFARSVCDYLEIFESLSPGREKVGYMVCCQRSMSRFGNRRFQSSARDFVPDDLLHRIVSDMHAELLVLMSRKTFDDRCLFRTFPHKTDPSTTLEISASLLRHHPAVSVLVSRVRRRVSEDMMR